MNSKERVKRILARQPVDRIPIGFFAIDFDTVERIIGHETYLRAKAKSQIAFWEGRRDEVAQSWIEDHLELHRKLELDIVTFPMATWEMPPGAEARVYTAAEFDREPPIARRDPGSWAILDAVIQKLKTDKYICGPSGGSIGIVLLGGMERGLLEIGLDPEVPAAAAAYLVKQQNLAD